MNKELFKEVCAWHGIDAQNAFDCAAFVSAVERAYNKGGMKAVHAVIVNFNF